MEPFSNPADILSQAEVERLLAQVSQDEDTLPVYRTGRGIQRRPKDAVQPYDFRNPVFLTPSELRKFRLRHEAFLRALAARLSIFLRLEFGLQMAKLQTIQFHKLIESFGNPTHLTLFKVEPLRGIGLLEVHPRLGLTIVDRLMGGAAHSVTADHDFSEIELALFDQAVQLILNEWCNLWVKIKDLRPSLLGHENNGRFLQTAAHDTIMVVLVIEARLGDCQEQIQLAFPYYTLEPLVRDLRHELDPADESTQAPAQSRPAWNPNLDLIKIKVSAQCQCQEITARTLSRLQPGDILPLQPNALNEVEILLAGASKFVGALGHSGERWAIQLTAPSNP